MTADERLTLMEVFQERIKNAQEMLEALSARLDRGIDQRLKAELIHRFVDNIKITTVTDEQGRKRPHATVTYLFSPPDHNSFGSDELGFKLSSSKL